MARAIHIVLVGFRHLHQHETGGIQEVIADDPTDAASVQMIVEHLTEEAAKFKAGDFSDPEAIHDWFEAQTSDHGGDAEHGT